MATSFEEAHKKIRRSVVGIGIRKDPAFTIFANGIIVHSTGCILTNKHVVERLLVEKDVKKGVRPGAAAFLFYQAKNPAPFPAVTGIMTTNIVEVTFPPEEKPTPEKAGPKFRGRDPSQILDKEVADYGLCRIDPANCHPDVVPLQPVSIKDSANLSEGMPVGILGFPQGLNIPDVFESRSQIQLTPILQTGVISAFLPFSGQPADSFLISIFVNPGSSGSPLFLPNGDVVGIVFATRQRMSALMKADKAGKKWRPTKDGVYIPTSLGLAVPSGKFPKEWISP